MYSEQTQTFLLAAHRVSRSHPPSKYKKTCAEDVSFRAEVLKTYLVYIVHAESNTVLFARTWCASASTLCIHLPFLPIYLSRARRSIGQRANPAYGTKGNPEIQLPRSTVVLLVVHAFSGRGRGSRSHDVKMANCWPRCGNGGRVNWSRSQKHQEGTVGARAPAAVQMRASRDTWYISCGWERENERPYDG